MKPWINLEYFYNQILKLFKSIYGAIATLLAWLNLSVIKITTLILSVILVIGIIYVLIKIFKLNKHMLKDAVIFASTEPSPENRRTRWSAIKKHLESESGAEWKLAVLEADSILDDIIKKIGIEGETMGERLKNIEQSDFDNLQNAWEAHKVRNRIAHEGVRFELTKEDAEKTIGLFEKCLKEFGYL